MMTTPEARVRSVPHAFPAAVRTLPVLQSRALAAAVRRLPPGPRNVFLLRRVAGLTQREIAMHLHKPESEIEALLAAAMHDCAVELARGRPAAIEDHDS